MTIKHAFSYYGSKAGKTHFYPAPQHATIIEPFAGSAAYSQQYWERDVILYDPDEFIAETWRYLIKATADEILALPDITRDMDIRSLDVPLGAQYLIGYWANQGTDRPRRTLTTRGQDRGWWNRDKPKIAEIVHHFNHWVFHQASYLEIPDLIGTWFIDPPYQVGGSYYRHRTIDYPALGKWCQLRRGQIIVCENGDADWLPFKPLFENQGMRKKTKEVVYISPFGATYLPTR